MSGGISGGMPTGMTGMNNMGGMGINAIGMVPAGMNNFGIN